MTTCGHSLFDRVDSYVSHIFCCHYCGIIATVEELAEAARERRRQRNEAT